jgi:hypothetical protein
MLLVLFSFNSNNTLFASCKIENILNNSNTFEERLEIIKKKEFTYNLRTKMYYYYLKDDEERLQVKDVIKIINPNLDEERYDCLSTLYVYFSRKFRVDVSYVVAIGAIESKFYDNAKFKGNYGVQQINWTAHKKKLNKYYQINNKDYLAIIDYINIEYSTYLIGQNCSNIRNKECNIRSLTRFYNGRINPKYENELRKNLSLFP